MISLCSSSVLSASGMYQLRSGSSSGIESPSIFQPFMFSSFILLIIVLFISSAVIMNKTGDIGDPWNTPRVVFIPSPSSPSQKALMTVFLCKLLILSIISIGAPSSASALHIVVLLTLSNANDRSINAFVSSGHLFDFSASFRNPSASLHPIFFLKPNAVSLIASVTLFSCAACAAHIAL